MSTSPANTVNLRKWFCGRIIRLSAGLAPRRGTDGELNLGNWSAGDIPGRCRSIGFTTHTGTATATATAADDWGAAPRNMTVRPAVAGRVEKLSDDIGDGEVMVMFDDQPTRRRSWGSPRLQTRHRPYLRTETERTSHHFPDRTADQFDAIIHLDHTTALQPLETNRQWESGAPPETFPYAV
jgi:erythromycin esterase-like protein